MWITQQDFDPLLMTRSELLDADFSAAPHTIYAPVIQDALPVADIAPPLMGSPPQMPGPFTFTVNDGEVIDLRVNGQSNSALKAYIKIFDAQGHEVTTLYPMDGTNAMPVDARLQFDSGGTFTAQFFPPEMGEGATLSAHAVSDDLANGLTTTRLLLPGVFPPEYVVHFDGDMDWMKIEVTDGQAFALRGFGHNGQRFWLLDDNGIVVADSHYALSGPSFSERIDYTAEYTGDYFIAATSWVFSPIASRQIHFSADYDGTLVNPVLSGTDFSDQIRGSVEADIIEGGFGHDNIDGGAGNDILNGGNGLDILTGGAGRDRFVVSLEMDTDTVTDFELSEDVIQIPEGLFASFGALLNAVTEHEGYIEIAFDGYGVMRLDGVSLTDLSTTHFRQGNDAIEGGNFYRRGTVFDKGDPKYDPDVMSSETIDEDILKKLSTLPAASGPDTDEPAESIFDTPFHDDGGAAL